MLFERRFWPAIAGGSVTVTFRRWRRRQVVAGHRYRTAAGIVEVTAVDVVSETAIDDEDARAAGYASADALRLDLRGTPDLPVYRVRFRHVDEPDPRDVLAGSAELTDAEVAELSRRLDRLDSTSAYGPWTAGTLDLIGRRPGVRAAELAEQLGRDRLSFKTDVRKLKNLGLTISLQTGYRLSPRGEAYLASRA